jgi:hypothetical protein
MILPVSQLYWYADEKLTVGRQFSKFMLHVQPEQILDELYGHCDQVFVHEMVPSDQRRLGAMARARWMRGLLLRVQPGERLSVSDSGRAAPGDAT